MERYSAFRDERDYEAEVDYRRKRGVLEEINLTSQEAEREARDIRNAEAALRGRNFDGPVEVRPLPPPTPPSSPPAPWVPPAPGAPEKPEEKK
jgi:hypothetical protein